MTSKFLHDIEIFTEATQLPIEKRAAYLDQVCAGDEGKRQRIEALLRSNDRAGGFLEEPAATIGEGRGKAAVGEKPGDRVDRYKLLQQIGEGGCGVVFVAEQQAPVVRRVALKVVKPGMDTKSVIARFEAERQALALMDHPNIAHVFDAGATGSVRPYFVMELVEGVKITDYCIKCSLPTKARLELFVQVCDAIQHAHQKGIIHRDIKPSNILVTTGADGKPVPKVIDFGIAKATNGQHLTDKTIFTAAEMLIGTPAYMSPEQAALSSTDVDTRTDIYSLGVLLYELLTGTTPFDTRELLKAGLDEVRRVIRDREPVRPSTRFRTMLATDPDNVSKHPDAESSRLIREMRGDLDWIVMKALEKDRSRRYATAYGLAMDIARYLSGEAILARPPSRVYKLRKLVSRHKLEFAVFAILLVTLITGLSISSWSLSHEKAARSEADEQRKKAEIGERKALTEAARSQQVTEIMKQMFKGVSPSVALGRDTKLLRELLDQTSNRIDGELTNEPNVLADLKVTIGGVYGALGQAEKGEHLIREALVFYRQSPEEVRQQIADALSALSILHVPQRPRWQEAEQEAREALAIETSLHGESTMRRVAFETRLGWAIVKRPGKAAEAEEIFRKALAEGRLLVGDESEQLLDARAGLATALSLLPKLDEAETVLRESLTIGPKKLGANHPYVANDMYRLALVLVRQSEVLDRQSQLDDSRELARQNRLEAESLYRQCLAIRRGLVSVDHPLLDEALAGLGLALYEEDKFVQAAEVFRELLGIRRRRFGDQDDRVSQNVTALSLCLAAGHDEVQFEELAKEFPSVWFARSQEMAWHGRWQEAVAAASKFLELQPEDPEAYHLAAPLLVQTGDRAAYGQLCEKIAARFAGVTNPAIADRMAKDCLILPRPGADLKLPGELAETAVTLGRGDSESLAYFQCCKALAEYRQGHWDGAVSWARKATENKSPYPRGEAYAVLAMAQHQSKQTDDSRAALKICADVVQGEMPKQEDGLLGGDWRDWIIVHALLAEAKSQIEGPTLPVRTPGEK